MEVLYRTGLSIMIVLEVIGTGVLMMGPPYPEEDKSIVRRVQGQLEKLGYDVGSTGIDGKYGPNTAGAVADWRKDFKVRGTSEVLDLDDQKRLFSSVRKKKADLPKRTATAAFTDYSLDDARASAEEYLGRAMSDKEWNYLVRATLAEASPNTREQGYVMSVILNRARKAFRGDTNIVDVLKSPYQFQAVTGTRFDKGPSKNFTRKPSKSELESISQAAIKVLPKADRSYTHFTSANPAAYGPGTDISFLKKMIAQGGVKIGQTVFGIV